MIWKFLAAPVEFQSLHRILPMPEWVALVPKSMYGDDLDQAFQKCSETGSIFRYESNNGDIILMGISQVAELVEVLATATPETDAEVE